MCGIVGLMIKAPAWHPRLGELLVPMLIGMTERGPDSAGLAVFGEQLPERQRKLSLAADDPAFDWDALEAALRALSAGATFARRSNHCIVTVNAALLPDVRACVRMNWPQVHVLSAGRRIDLFKEVGTPAEVSDRYGFSALAGSHAVAHTRMATESAVAPENAHPYTAGEDWCLVHNGSLANPGSLRRRLEKKGEQFESDCDTEAACRYLHWRQSRGDTLETAIKGAFEDFDGFYTFLMGNETELALVRDPFACKPAIVAETDDYVAIASEFRSLAHLPGIADASVFEPEPSIIYRWSTP